MKREDEEKLANLLLVWEEARKKDFHLTIDELCAQSPHLKPELMRRILLLKTTDWMDDPGKPGSPVFPKATAGVAPAQQPWHRYQTGKLVGESRISNVWCGFDVELHRVIAIKVLKQEQMTASEPFLAAARQHAALRHPGIVQIHDIVARNNATFIVLDFMERGNLKKYLTEKGIELNQATQWAIQLAETLGFLHGNGITHQNVKPENILIDKGGKAVLSDAGLCQGGIGQTAINPAFTQSLYTSPEQLSGNPISPGSDIYSLAVVFHEMATGKLPFASGNTDNPKSPTHVSRIKIADTLPRHLVALLKRSLSDNPAARPPSAAAFVSELKYNGPANPSRRTMLPALVASAMAAAGLFIWSRSKPGLSSAWLRELFSSTPQQQAELIKHSLMARNPGFNGPVKAITESGILTGLEFCTDTITDISPLSPLQNLKFLKMTGSAIDHGNGLLEDLAPLRTIRLEHLEITNNEHIKTLDPLRGMPLGHLNVARTSVEDLAPLAGSPLETCIASMTSIISLDPLADTLVNNLWFDHTKVKDISLMRDMKLHMIRCYKTPIDNIDSLKNQPLKALDCYDTNIQDIAPLTDMKSLRSLNIIRTPITNFRPLLTLPGLRYLWCDFNWATHGDIIRNLVQLEKINGIPHADIVHENSKP